MNPVLTACWPSRPVRSSAPTGQAYPEILCGAAIASVLQHQGVLAHEAGTTAVVTAVDAATRSALRVQVRARLHDAACRELRSAVEDILADPEVSWEVIAPGHGDADPWHSLELDAQGRVGRLVPGSRTPPPDEYPGTAQSPVTTSTWRPMSERH